MSKIILTTVAIVCWLLAGCTPEQAAPSAAVVPTPTTVYLFGMGSESAPSASTNQTSTKRVSVSSVVNANVPSLTAGLDESPALIPQNYREVLIFDEKLNSNWSLDQSENVTYDLLDTSHWFETLSREHDILSGAVSAAVAPQDGSGRFYFTVSENASEFYPRSRVLGLSFWLNSGNDYVDTDDLSINVVGSNSRKFWTPDFDAEFQDSDSFFFETRLYMLDVNRSIPPRTWTQVIVWMDELIFAPDYDFVTGVYIKNDSELSTTYYIDRMALLLDTQ